MIRRHAEILYDVFSFVIHHNYIIIQCLCLILENDLPRMNTIGNLLTMMPHPHELSHPVVDRIWYNHILLVLTLFLRSFRAKKMQNKYHGLILHP